MYCILFSQSQISKVIHLLICRINCKWANQRANVLSKHCKHLFEQLNISTLPQPMVWGGTLCLLISWNWLEETSMKTIRIFQNLWMFVSEWMQVCISQSCHWTLKKKPVANGLLRSFSGRAYISRANGLWCSDAPGTACALPWEVTPTLLTLYGSIPLLRPLSCYLLQTNPKECQCSLFLTSTQAVGEHKV